MVFITLSWQMPGDNMKLGHDHFLSHLFPFMTYCGLKRADNIAVCFNSYLLLDTVTESKRLRSD